MRGSIAGLGIVLWSLMGAVAYGQTSAAAPVPSPPATTPPAAAPAPAPTGTPPTATAPAGTTPPPAPLSAADCARPFPPAAPPAANQTTLVQINSQTAWRPRGDAVEFSLAGPGVATDSVEVMVCYRWKTVAGKTSTGASAWVAASDLRPVAQSNVNSVSFASTVPPELPGADSWLKRWHDKTLSETTQALGLIPLADMRIIVRQKTTAAVFLDVVRPVGISNRKLAFFAALAAVAIAWMVLLGFAEKRGTPGRNPLLRLVTTGTGYASLSQFQIILWTFVVGASTVYVMVLAGNLVAISAGTLVLLGISGAATVVAKVQDFNAAAAAAGGAAASPPPASPPSASPPPAASPPPLASPTPAPTRQPQWSDLVTAADNPREIDVTRVQMLFFTVIVALFVSMRVLSSGVVPEIPEGFLTLMGISNGVYLTSKFIPNRAS